MSILFLVGIFLVALILVVVIGVSLFFFFSILNKGSMRNPDSPMTKSAGNFDPVGPSVSSPNGHYELRWEDPGVKESSSGYVPAGKGIYALYLGGKRLFCDTMQVPNMGQVCNTGTFVLTKSSPTDLSSETLFVLTPTNEVLISRRFKANIQCVGISESGRYVACKNYGSDYEPHGDYLFIFDISNGKPISKFYVNGVPSSLIIDENQKVIAVTASLIDGPDETLRYSFNGECLDSTKLREKSINSGSGYEIAAIADEDAEKIDSSNLGDFTEVLNLYQRAASMDMADFRKAKVHRCMGEIHLRCGDKKGALENLEAALGYDPRIGVKRRVDTLRRELNKDT